MAALRKFQNEIDEIHHKEVVKQRAQASTAAVREKAIQEAKKSPTVPVKTGVKDPAPAEPAHNPLDDPNLLDVEVKIQVSLPHCCITQ